MKFSRSFLVLVLSACTLGAFGQSPRSDIVTLQSAATATGNGTALDVGLYGGVAVQVTGSFTATITFEATIDRTNWIAVKADNLNDRTSATTATAAGIFQVPLSGAVQFRARVSAYTGGTVTVKARGVAGQISLKQSSGGGGGSGTVTDFSAGDLSPLFTTSEANTTTTPALSFSLSNALAHKFFGNNTGSTGAPDFVSIGTGDLPSGIPYGNLNLTGAILNADLAGSIANAKLANSAITIAGNSTSLGGSITASTILDSIGSTRGTVLYRGVSGWAALTPGTSGQFLQTQGAGADPQWAAGGGGITIGTTTITSGTNTRVLYNNAGVVGEYTVTGTAGNVVLSQSPTLTGTVAMAAQTNSGTIVQTSASATAFESGPNGSTNPVFRLVNNTASQADGLSITGLAAGNGVTLQALSSGANTPITISAKGSGNIVLSNSGVSLTMNTGQLVFVGAPVFTGSGIRMANSQSLAFSNGVDYGRGLTGITGGVRVNQGESSSTGQGNFLITSSTGSVGTSGVGVLVMQNGTAPSSSPADEFQLYSADSAAGDANAFARNEAGEVNRLTGLTARVSTQFDKTSDTTLANVTGLSRNVEAGRTYAFTAVLYTTSNVAGGVKAAIGGTATATSIIYQAEVLDGSTLATVGTARATALATAVGDVTAVTAAKITITGTIVVNAAGTLTVQFAQNASNGTASSVLVNSSFQLIPIS